MNVANSIIFLSELIADKRKQLYSKIKTWIMCKISLLLMNSIDLCLRGSRSIFSSGGCNDKLESSIQEDAMISKLKFSYFILFSAIDCSFGGALKDK